MVENVLFASVQLFRKGKLEITVGRKGDLRIYSLWNRTAA